LGNPATYTTVRAADGKEWLRQHIGSSQVATTSADAASYGDLFQWGRWDDGHQLRSPGNTINGIASPNNPTAFSGNPNGPNAFYHNSTSGNHWCAGGISTDTWSGISFADISSTSGIDPCKKLMGNGWRLPTGGAGGEWQAISNAEGITNAATAFASNLKLPI